MVLHVFCKSCEPEIAFVLICPLAEQFHVRKSYKTHESTLSCIGNFEENIDLSQTHLAIPVRPRFFDQVGHETMYACI